MSCRINKLFENNPTGCQWQIKEKIGSGQQATVYKVCCDNEEKCDYAVKVYKKVNEEAFHNEVNIHYELTNLGLAVPIMEAFYCDDHGAYIIMERRQMNAQEYIFKLVDNNVPHDYIMNQIEKLRKDCLNLVLSAYKNRIEQTDANIANFMLDMNGNDYNNIGMIDFAYANKFGDNIKPEYTREDKINDVNQTINLLITDYNSYKNKRISKEPPAIDKRKSKTVSRIEALKEIPLKRYKTEQLSYDNSKYDLAKIDTPVKNEIIPISSEFRSINNSPYRPTSMAINYNEFGSINNSPYKPVSRSINFETPEKKSSSSFIQRLNYDDIETPKKNRRLNYDD